MFIVGKIDAQFMNIYYDKPIEVNRDGKYLRCLETGKALAVMYRGVWVCPKMKSIGKIKKLKVQHHERY